MRNLDRLLLVAVLLLGLGEAYLFYKSPDMNRGGAALAVLPPQPPLLPGMPVAGDVKDFGKDDVTVEHIAGSKDAMRFHINSETQFVERAQKSPDKVQAEMQAFTKGMQKVPQPGGSFVPPPPPPAPFEDKKADAVLLKQGAHVIVEPENATDKKDVARKITVLASEAPPASPPPSAKPAEQEAAPAPSNETP